MLSRETIIEIKKATQVIVDCLKAHQEAQQKLQEAENAKVEKTKFQLFKTHKKKNPIIVPELFNYELAIEELTANVNEFIDSEDFSSDNRGMFQSFLNNLYVVTGDEELRLQSKVLYLHLFRIPPKVEDKRIQNDARYIYAIGGSPVYQSSQSLSTPADSVVLKQKLSVLASWEKIMANQPPEQPEQGKPKSKGVAINQTLANKYF